MGTYLEEKRSMSMRARARAIGSAGSSGDSLCQSSRNSLQMLQACQPHLKDQASAIAQANFVRREPARFKLKGLAGQLLHQRHAKPSWRRAGCLPRHSAASCERWDCQGTDSFLWADLVKRAAHALVDAPHAAVVVLDDQHRHLAYTD